MPSCVRSTVRLFADDSLVYRNINNEEDARQLQQDLDSLQDWERDWQMSFHPEKYKLEFDVQMTCNRCVNAVQKSLDGIEGVKDVKIDLDRGQVLVETTLSASDIQDKIESSGRRAVLKGMGSTEGSAHLGAAVSIFEAGSGVVKGLVRLVQTDQENCVIDGTVDGLTPGKHALCVHECGDLSSGCLSCGDVLRQPGSSQSVGELGDITAGPNGRADFRMVNERLKIWDLIGRSMMLHSVTSDQAHTDSNDPKNRLVCGVIARSAGLFQNPKKFCACDGVTQWDERDRPLAGAGRQARM